MTLKVIGIKCNRDFDCFTQVEHSHCSFRGLCECVFGYIYDQPTDSCFKRKSYSESCSLRDDCHNDLLICSEFGVCICRRGHYYDLDTGFCQPLNKTGIFRGCAHGMVWDASRNRCIRRQAFPTVVDTGHNSYDRNRYSLFFAILIPILLLMIFLLKAKKHTSNPFGFNSRRVSRNSYAEALSLARESEYLPWNQLSLRLSEAGFHPHGHRSQYSIPRLTDQNANYCVNYHPPPPPYSSTLNLLSTASDRSEKPPSYEEAVYLSSFGHHQVVNHNNNNLVSSPSLDLSGDPCSECSSSSRVPVVEGHHYYYGNPVITGSTCPQSLLVLNQARGGRHGRLLGSFIQGRERGRDPIRREIMACPSSSISVLTSTQNHHEEVTSATSPSQVIICEDDLNQQQQHTHQNENENHVESTLVPSSNPDELGTSCCSPEEMKVVTQDQSDAPPAPQIQVLSSQMQDLSSQPDIQSVATSSSLPHDVPSEDITQEESS